ncbi:MAG: sulfotransferase domain-containing protein, partial [Phycisphaerales bacterium]
MDWRTPRISTAIEGKMPESNDAHRSAEPAAAATLAAPRARPKRRPPGRAADRSFSLILCAGMPRAGSTLQYNLIRLLAECFLEARAGGWAQSYDDFAARFPEYSRRGGAPRVPLVLKAHEFDARYAALIDPPPRPAAGEPGGHTFCVYRDVRDALVSYTRQFGGSLDDNIARWTTRWIEWTEHWCGLVNVTISRYETLMRDPRGELLRYARALGIQAPDGEINDILAACSAG